MAEWRLPRVNQDDGIWGDILVQFLEKEHYNDDTDNAAENGGHQKITVRAGTTSAGTAPIKLTSGSLMTAAEAGAIEFLTDDLYFTISTGTSRRKVALYDDTSGATGDLYYRNSSGYFTRYGIGSTGQVLNVTGGVPTWSANNSGYTTTTKVTGQSPYSVTTSDAVIFADAASGNVTITLPAAAAGNHGFKFYIKRIDSASNTVTVDTAGGNIDGAASHTLPLQYQSITVVSNGSNWFIL
jgi:hypothetical protein